MWKPQCLWWVQYFNCKTVMTCVCTFKRNLPRGRIWQCNWGIHKHLRTISDHKQAALLLCVSDNRLSFQMWWHWGTRTCADEILSLMSSTNMVILKYEFLWQLKSLCVLPIGNYWAGSVSPLALVFSSLPPCTWKTAVCDHLSICQSPQRFSVIPYANPPGRGRMLVGSTCRSTPRILSLL